MKCPEETMEKFRAFTESIKKEKWRINFLLEGGYLNFIYDLENECIKLAAICKEIRRKYGEDLSE